MTREAIIRMAREAGGTIYEVDWCFEIENLQRFAALVAAAEREACAALCKRFANRMMSAEECADAIRDRGVK